MEDGVFCPSNGIYSPPDEVLSGGGQYLNSLIENEGSRKRQKLDLDPNIVGNLPVLDQASNKVEIGIACSRVCYFDLFYTCLHQHPKERCFLFNGHWIGKGLVPVPQIRGEPDGDPAQSLRWPLAVRNVPTVVKAILQRLISASEVLLRW